MACLLYIYLASSVMSDEEIGDSDSECDDLEQVAAKVLAAAEAPRAWIANACRREGVKVSAVIQQAKECEEELLSFQTPWGPIIQECRCSSGDGQPSLTITYCNLPAYLFALCSMNAELEPFLYAHARVREDGCAVCRTIFYCDDVRPGNLLRPDAGRTYYAFYLGFMDLPHWFITGANGWFDWAFAVKTEVDAVPAGLSAVTASLFAAVRWPMEFDLPTETGGRRRYQLDFGAFLSDEKAIKQVTFCKGASGYKPCICCANVVGRMPPADVASHTYFKHFSTCRPADFDLYTADRWAAMCQHVRDVVSAGGEEAANVTTSCGVGFHTSALPFVDGGDLSRRVMKLPESIFWDSMHSMWSSGGIGQYHLNQFLRRVRSAGIPLKTMHAFMNTIESPVTTHAKFDRFDLMKRVQQKNSTDRTQHIKAFAGECLDLTGRLLVWACFVLLPAGRLLEDMLCLSLLHDIGHILSSAGLAVRHNDYLARLVEQYADMYLRLYEECIKPKLHYVRHLPGMIRKFGINLTCFSMERHHRKNKTLATFLYRNIGDVILRRVLCTSLMKMRNPEVLRTNIISDPWTRKRTRWAGLLRDLDPDLVLLELGSSIRTACGEVKAKQFWLWRSEASPSGYAAGVIEECWLARSPLGDGSPQPLLLVREYEIKGSEATPNIVVMERRDTRRLVHAGRVLFATFYVPTANGARASVLVPRSFEALLAAGH